MSLMHYAMVSTELRRDLDDPLSFFQRRSVTHFYNKTPWKDMTQADFSERLVHYASAAQLYGQLRRINPDVVQGVELFALITQPRALVISQYVASTRKPLVLVSCENLPYRSKYGPLALPFEPLIRRSVSQARLIIAINEGARDNFLHYGADPARIVRLMYGTWGVNVDEFTPEGPPLDLPQAAGRRVILFLGRVHRIKGVYDLLNAFGQFAADHPNTDLVFAGDGPDRETLGQQATAMGLAERVHLLGTVKNRDVPALMRRADVVAAPSVTTRTWAEQIGMVLIQALGCGVPVVSTTSGSIPEFVDDGRTALLVPEQDPTALADALRRVLSDNTLAARLREAGRADALVRYDARRNIAEAERVITARCTS